MQALLNIKEYFVDEISVRTNHDFAKKDVSTSVVNVDFEIKRSNANPLEFMIPMTIEVNNQETSFSVAEYLVVLKLTGFFCFVEGTDEEIINKMIGPSGLSILYGVARGVVAQVTGNSWHGKFILPSMNFIELMKGKAQAIETAKKISRRKRK
jgi:preprotein translocase subunit SecB